MNIFADIQKQIIAIVERLGEAGKLPKDLDVSRVTVEPPRDAAHGDMASNVAMVLAKQASMNPHALAALLIEELRNDERVAQAEIAGPGFINIKLQPNVWTQIVPHILAVGINYGKQPESDEKVNVEKVNVEYVSANPTGPMHVGHARGAVLGDVLASLLQKTGRQVVREYYVNDAGAQIEVLARSALMRMREALGEKIDAIGEGLYPGDYLIPVGQALAKKYGADLLAQDEAAQIKAARAVALPMMLDLIRTDLAALGVTHDVFVSEQDLYEAGAVDKAVATLRDKGLVYEGILEPPKGDKRRTDDGDDGDDTDDNQPQLLFRASQFGDDSDRALQKSDGSWSYFAPDIAYHADKVQRGFTRLIDIWGADHAGYIKRMQAAVAAMTDGQANLEVKSCNLVKLKRGNVPVKMSKRSGEFVTLSEVVDEVGKAAMRFMMLTRKSDAPLDFDFALVKEKSRDNPVFYVQYAHARICSVVRQAKGLGFTPKNLTDEELCKADISLLTDPAEHALIRQIAAYPRLLLAAAESGEPHRIAFYLQDLAGYFHALWNLGKTQPELRFLREDDQSLSYARLALLRAVAITLASGLDVIGIEPETQMR